MRRLLVVLAVLVVLAGGLVVADRVLAARAEQRAAAGVAANLDVVGEPAVTIEDFPFVTQLLAGEISRATATADGLRAGGIELTDVRATGRDVALTRPPTVGDLEVTATVPEDVLAELVAEQLPERLDVDVDSRPDGVSLSTRILGLDLAVRTTPEVVDGGLQVAVEKVTLAGAEIDPERVADLVGRRIGPFDVPLELPLGLSLVSAEPGPGGLRVTLHGTDVVLDEPA